jgi:hypothetical protein
MRDKLNLAFIDVGGWGPHVNEGGAQGQLATLLGNLSQGHSAFAQRMGPAWSSTVVVVISESPPGLSRRPPRGAHAPATRPTRVRSRVHHAHVVSRHVDP